ncbi:TIGR04255 family protein [Pelovirga terrestris]|uniref:TIGR04255 family protein n=1 Tax=Pelovirga terrestris TaxID=2771352 RepID=A0A8J6UKH8_9BACT|nr:TIGR04255 family protein [Pelovirga terrestris]MBD1399437.1 TIGR04255 family protein [Pelovirga terrestris]
MPLPKKLKMEPLIDVVFEIRFKSVISASSILPGLLFERLEGEKKIEKLPASQLPEQVRTSDPNLKYAPLLRIVWKNFAIMISDNGVAVGCILPYPGWSSFKKTIIELVGHLSSAKIIKEVERYSLKYIDIIPAKSLKDQVSAVNLSLTIGKHKLESEFFQVRVDIPIDDLINIMVINSSASVALSSGEKRNGVVVDIDTILNIGDDNIEETYSSLEKNLERMHDLNGELFFSCLREETIEMLEPVYE